ncbi:MAG: hypothetical protein ACRDRV_14475 [Pseudonocardiaceae bacterium]
MTSNSGDRGSNDDPRAAAATPLEVAAQASGGIRATVVVTVQQGAVLMSIVPPFTWEAIMAPKMVDELIYALTQARNEATAIPHRTPPPHAKGQDNAI